MKATKILAALACAGMLSACQTAENDKVSSIYFNFNSTKLSQSEKVMLDKLADKIKNQQQFARRDNDLRLMEATRVSLSGHTDSVGSKSYNGALAKKRVQAVMNELIARGVEPHQIRVDVAGEDEMKVKTPDNVRERLNRRVDIIME